MSKRKKRRVVPPLESRISVPPKLSTRSAVDVVRGATSNDPPVKMDTIKNIPPSPPIYAETSLLERIAAIFKFRTERMVTDAIEGKPLDVGIDSFFPSWASLAVGAALIIAAVVLDRCL